MKKKSIFAATYVAVASVWLGGHFGPGFATGVFSAQYYEKYGVIGLFMPLLAMLLTGGVMFYMVEYARSHGTTNYRSFVESAFGDGALAKIMPIFYDILFIGTVIGAGGLAVAGEANILGKLYGLGHAVYTLSDPRAVLLRKFAGLTTTGLPQPKPMSAIITAPRGSICESGSSESWPVAFMLLSPRL